MPARYSELVRVSHGLAVTGKADDPGLYLLVPAVSRWFHLSIAHAYDLSIGVLILSAAILGALPIKKWTWLSAGYFLVAVGMTAYAGDVYIFEALPAIAGIPWLLRNEKHAFWIAALAGMCGVFRSWAFLPYLALLVLMLWRKRPVIAAAVIPLCLVPQMWAHHAYPETHPFWHSVYIGLGWVPNSEVSSYHDEVGFRRGIELGTVPYTPQYEAALRSEVERIAEHEPWIIAEELAAKITILALSIALLLRFTMPVFPFAAAILVGVLPGILVTPNPKYVLGALCLTAFCTQHSPSSDSAAWYRFQPRRLNSDVSLLHNSE